MADKLRQIAETDMLIVDDLTGDVLGIAPGGNRAKSKVGGTSGAVFVPITETTTLDFDLHNGNILRCTAPVTLTYPDGLGAEFSCLAESPASGDVTIDPTGACTVNGATDSLTRGRTNNPAGFVIRALAANVAGVSGS